VVVDVLGTALGLAPFAQEAIRALVGKNAHAKLIKLVEADLRRSDRVPAGQRDLIAVAWAGQRVDPGLGGRLVAWLATGKDEYLQAAGAIWRELLAGVVEGSDADVDELVGITLQIVARHLARAQGSDRDAVHVEAGAIKDHVTRELSALGVQSAPQLQVAVDAAQFARRQPNIGAPDVLIGRSEQLDELVGLLAAHQTVEVVGVGGVGKTRLLLDAHTRIGAGRTLFLDDRARLDSDLLGSELAGTDELTLVVDNAHRREDLRQVVGLLSARTGATRLVLIARPGYDERLRQATEGSAFGVAGATCRMSVERLSGKEIGALVRAAEPKLAWEGAVEQIVAVAAGNPLIALLAHRVASSRGGLHGLAFNDLLGEYARSAVATAVAARPDVKEDDLRDVLAVVAALGPIGPADEDLVASLLEVPARTVRHRIADLADAGLLAHSGEQLAISPDLLAAHVLQQAHLAGARGSAVRYAEIWEAADEDRRDGMCSALGALHGFDVSGGAGVSAVVGDALAELAAANAVRVLTRAQSLAPGLPDVALGAVDIAVGALPNEKQARERALLVAMEVLSRVSDVSAGWPRQLAVAQAFFARSGTNGATKKIHDALTTVYKRLPRNTSVYDGHVLAHVQDVLADATSAYWTAHRGEPGCTRTVAIAASQLLTVVSERSYTSAEDDMTIKLIGGFLPAGDRTARLLRAGSRLLYESLPALELDQQQSSVRPIMELRRTARGLGGPFGATPSEELVTLACKVLEELTGDLGELDALPLPTRAALLDALGSNPWTHDDELREFCELLAWRPAEHMGEYEARAEHHATVLLTAEDPVAELRRWQTWLLLAQHAGMRQAAQMTVGPALVFAAGAEPGRIADALEMVLADGGPLAGHAAGALGELVSRADGEEFMRRLASDAPSATRAAVAGGLAATSQPWADVLLQELADSPDEQVRWAVAHTAGWTPGGSVRRLRTGLRACLPANVGNALSLLAGAARRTQEDGLVPLEDEAASTLAALAANAAREPRIEGYKLAELGKLAQLPRLAVEACLARVRWLIANPVKDFEEMMGRDGLPDELSDATRRGAEDRDRVELIEFIENPALDGEARANAVKLLTWIDDHDVVTDRLGRWLASDDEQVRYSAFEMLRQTRAPEQFKARARSLLATDPPLDLAQILIEARQPAWMMGSEKVALGRIADEFETWIDDDDPRIANTGRIAAARFRQEASRVDGDEEDQDTEWG